MRTDSPNPAVNAEMLVPAVAGLTALGLLYGVLEIGARLSTGTWANTTELVGVLTGDQPWTGWHTATAAALLVVVAAAVYPTVRLVRRYRATRTHVDRKAHDMGQPGALSRAVAERKAADGRMTVAGGDPGLMLGRAVKDGSELWAGWRDGMCIEMGPGSGKTTGFAVPLVMDAPGVVVATSNKRDLADAVRGACEARGTFWCFDPQGIANYHQGGRPPFWWNPLAGVTGPVEAESLAQIWSDASSPAGASKDGYFDSAGPALLGCLLLAAAVNGSQLPQVFIWLTASDLREPVKLLRDNGFALTAAALHAAHAAAPDERSGLFSTAQKAVKWLTSPEILAWVTDEPAAGEDARPEFDPPAFVRSGRDTLISLSREGMGSAGPLTTALTAAVTTAAEKYAQQHAHGRLPVPLVAVLDEVANVCRWRDLPSLFSFYGSSGIFLVAILQNWAQGVLAWKQHGMQQIWDAATIRVVGAGLADRGHLEDVSKIIGERHVRRRSAGTSNGKGRSRSTNVSFEHEPIMSVDELSALPPGRFVALTSGGYPILARTVPWYERPDLKSVVGESIAQYEPRGVKS